MSGVKAVGEVLQDKDRPLKERFRALFTLRNLGGNDAVDIIGSCFDDESALLKHELAYCLGQMQNTYAVPLLIRILEDKNQETIVRHEAGEALGAIADASAIEVLKKYLDDPAVEIAETCQLALGRITWLKEKSREEADLPPNPFFSVDPTPPAKLTDIKELREILLNEDLPLFQRYRAMFTLRNVASQESVLALAEGLLCKSALFRHEIAYVLGQVQHEACISHLAQNLQDVDESPMVRHECADALGAIATPEAVALLEQYLKDNERVVRESCIVALDMSEYENCDQFQYADTLTKVHNGQSSDAVTETAAS